MATATLAVIRAARPALRHPHDKVAYAVHAAVMARGWSLVATGAAADTDPPPGSEPPEVSHDGWASEEEAYSFRYRHPDTHAGLLLKAVRMGGTLVLSTLSTSHPDVRFFEVDVAEYTTEATDYVKGYKALDWLLECVGDALLDEPPAARAATLAGDAPSSSPPTADDPSARVGQHPDYAGPMPPGLRVGDADRFGPSSLMDDRFTGGSMVGPGHPMFAGGPMGPGGRLVHPPGVPFGARYDPIGPPGVPGFEPERFMPPRQPPSRQPGQQNWPGNHPDLPPHRNDDMFM